MAGMETSLQRAMSVLLTRGNIAFHEYVAMAHCRRSGFVVRRPETPIVSGDIRVSFTAWAAGTFRRRTETAPAFHLMVQTTDMPPPSFSSVTDLMRQCSPTPLHLGMVDHATVIFSRVSDLQTPLTGARRSPVLPIEKTLRHPQGGKLPVPAAVEDDDLVRAMESVRTMFTSRISLSREIGPR